MKDLSGADFYPPLFLHTYAGKQGEGSWHHLTVHHAVPSGLLAAGVLNEAVGLELAEDAVDGGLGEMGPFHDFDG